MRRLRQSGIRRFARVAALFAVAAALGVRFAFAADLLRAGAAPASGTTAATASGGATATASAALAANAQDRLARTAQALQAVKTMQDAARALAASGANNLGLDPNHLGQTLANVPNGLGLGGLQVATGVPVNLAAPTASEDATLWQGAALPTQTTSGTQTTVTIVQSAQQALLTWQSFNVGKATTLKFDQSAGGDAASEWIAFNRILDPTASPTQILGSIQAQGQVYILNANGIIFGGSSQVNAHALVASALPINDNLIARGLLNNPDTQFLFSALAQPAGANGTPAFTPDTPASGKFGDVTVQAGATISTPTNDAHVGGRIALIGANVTNAGTLATPDGQTILAAGSQVGLAAHASADPSLRGLDVYVGAVADGAGTATNSGLISAPRANVTIAGKAVNQLGFVDSSTSVSLNGRIDLLAEYDAKPSGGYADLPAFFARSTGVLTLGAKSVTQILPELASTETVVGTTLALGSQLNFRGQAVHLAAQASVLAPSASVAVSAGRWNFLDTGATSRDQFVFTDGQIYFDAGATIDVAGSVVSASVAENFISVQLRGTELADSPLLRDGALRGQTIEIDTRVTGTYNGKTWIGTPLANTTGYVGLIQRSVGELTTAGGTVNLNAGEAVVMQAGSTINTAGGWIDYQGANVQTSQVLSGGRVYDISQATPDRVYDGLYTGTTTTTDSRWGATQTDTNALPAGARYEAGYRQGANGGSLSISAASMALDGTLQGGTVIGPRQRTASTMPTPSALSLFFRNQDASYAALPYHSPTPASILFATKSSLAAADAFALDASGQAVALRADRKASVVLSPDLLTTGGFGQITIENRDGDITLPAGAALNAAARGSISFVAANIDLEGSVSAPGGTLKFEAADVATDILNALSFSVGAKSPTADPTRGKFTLGAGARLTTAGLIVDDRPTSASANTLALATAGGAVSIKAYQAKLLAGSAIDVSGGVAASGTGKMSYGAGGSIAIAAGQDPTLLSVTGGGLSLAATLTGFSGSTGGALSVLAPAIQIGGTTANASTLLFAPDFFNQGGFASFALTGLGVATGQPDEFVAGLTIAPGTTIAPTVQSWLADPNGSVDASILLTPTLLPVGSRSPVSLTFAAQGVRDPYNSADPLLVRGDLVMGAGATINTDPKGSVTLSGDTALVLGSIFAPAGSIAVTGGKDSNVLYPKTRSDQVFATVYLGPSTVLSAAGTTLLTPDARGYRTGSVLAGGSIAVSGNLVAATGSLLDVSGATDVLDVAPDYGLTETALYGSLTGSQLVPLRQDSAGGRITLTGGQELFSDATLRAAAGGPAAAGGSLTVSSGRFVKFGSGALVTPLDTTLEVQQARYATPTKAVIGQTLPVTTSGPSGGWGHLAVDSFASGGFSAVALNGTVGFTGAVSLSATRSLTVGSAGVLRGNGAVSLTAPYVMLGQAFLPPQSPDVVAQSPFVVGGEPFNFDPTYGAGMLTVRAQLIDLGNLSFQGIGNAEFYADGGDVRGDGIVDLAGRIYFRAGQVYPPTGVSFTIAAYDYLLDGTAQSGSVKIAASGTRSLPLSAGGELNVYGSIIHQGGVLQAPLGTINLGAATADTAPIDLITGKAFDATQVLSLDAGSETSVAAIDPVTGAPLVVPYGINLNGTAWIDPSGTDITLANAPTKSVSVAANEVYTQSGSTINLDGGGDLYAYRWVSGVGGTSDVLATTTSFAVVPGYAASYAPYAAYATSTNLGTDRGYTNASLTVGDSIYLEASAGLPAGFYTLLPARYALLPGAFLVTPRSGQPTATAVKQPDGASVVAGYRFNTLDTARTAAPLLTAFEVASKAVVQARAQYESYAGGTFLSASATANNAAVPRLPVDSGQLVLIGAAAMNLRGTVSAHAATSGRGGLIDISSPVDIVIGGAGGGGAGVAAGSLYLSAADLNAFGSESLLLGGIRHQTTAGTTVDVTTEKIIVNNASTPLTGSDVILVADGKVIVAPGAAIASTGTASTAAETLLFGAKDTAGSGNGALVRISADPTAGVARFGVDDTTAPGLAIGAGASLTGAGVVLDSTAAFSLDSRATVTGQAVTLDSSQISVVFGNAGSFVPTTGLILAGDTLAKLQTTSSVSLLSYSTIDLYGTGQFGSAGLGALGLHAGAIRGFGQGDGTVTFAAGTITLDNAAAGSAPTALAAKPTGTLAFNATTLRLGDHELAVQSFADLRLTATTSVIAAGEGGLTTAGRLSVVAPLITADTAANTTVAAAGDLTLQAPAGGAASTAAGGLGASLTFTGLSVSANTRIALPSGALTLHATDGDLLVGNLAATPLEVGGTALEFYDVTKYTSGGFVNLLSDHGAVTLGAGAKISVAAPAGGGDAGVLTVVAPEGAFTAGAAFFGTAGANGAGGSFSLDAGSLPGGSLKALDALLNSGGFSLARAFRVRTGDVAVDGLATAHSYAVSADAGSILVSGKIDASGATGGVIELAAAGSVTLAAGAQLTVAAQDFDSAGKGGAVSLAAGQAIDGVTDATAQIAVSAGAKIDLSVSAITAESAAKGRFAGTLQLRAPQTTDALGNPLDVQIAPVAGTITGASSVTVEGFSIFDLTATGGDIGSDVQARVLANGTAFAANTPAILDRLFGAGSALATIAHVTPGAEIINRSGDLTLASSWDLSTFRFGPGVTADVAGSGEAGVLTLRAAGNLVFAFKASLSDGFAGADYTALLLPAGARSWTYRLVAGADLGAADTGRVQALTDLGADAGSVLVGSGATALPETGTEATQRQTIIPDFFQTIRTGTGDIAIAAGRDVRLLNPLASIYTAGTQADDLANFALPKLTYSGRQLGATQNPIYTAQYSLAGGNVSISAQHDIGHYLADGSGGLIADSSRELPTNWLYRRGYVDPVTGEFGVTRPGGEIASTSWWVDFSNFFEGVGALGGGNVSLIAGHDVSNVDAVAPTNARMPSGKPDASALVELGGGDVTVRAGHDIDGGVYYVERGEGALTAGHDIRTNATRAALTKSALVSLGIANLTPDATTWLPTTLFAGDARFTVAAGGDVLLGPVANPFLLPQGINNSFFEKSYFTTYTANSGVAVTSLTGDVTLKDNADGGAGSLLAWYGAVDLLYGSTGTFALSQPWLRLAETDVTLFATAAALMPGSLQASALLGDVNIVGTLTLAPAPTGTVEVVAAGSVQGVQLSGLFDPTQAASEANPHLWGSANIVLSDADPARLPGVATPLSLGAPSSDTTGTSWIFTPLDLMDNFNRLFAESGSTKDSYAVIQTKQALHASGVLHAADLTPARIYAKDGDISGLTFFSPKSARVLAGQDITDLSLYVQNTRADDVTTVAAGRDLVVYNPNSPARVAAQSAGNALFTWEVGNAKPATGSPAAGDIQISGPGTLEVLAGRNFDLGVGVGNADGTGLGITSIGNARNPYLPFTGADVIAAAGIGAASGLDASRLDVTSFVDLFLNPASTGSHADRYLPELGKLIGLPGASRADIWQAYGKLAAEKKAQLAVEIFFRVLRNAGRDHNDPTSAGYRSYDAGFAAIKALFPGNTWSGDFSLTSREIKTAAGGDISLLAPGGQLTVGFDLGGNQPVDQGILTEHGGAIAIFTHGSVNVGTSRIFTLRGGDETIWSSAGNIAAGASSKTVQSAPPTRVLIDPQSADVQTDLAGLATGGGIGVLATVAGVAPGDVDLIAPTGTIDAGDAGIRVSGNINIAAVQVLNSNNVQAGGASSGVPGAVAAPSLGGALAVATSAGATTNTAAAEAARGNRAATTVEEVPSIIAVEVLGYGGGDAGDDSGTTDEEEKKRATKS